VADVLLPASSIYPRTGPGARETCRFRHRQAGDRRRYLPLVMELASRATAHTTRQGGSNQQAAATSEKQLHRRAHLRRLHPVSPPTCATCGDGFGAPRPRPRRGGRCAHAPVRPDRIRAPPAATGGRKDQPRVSACDGSVSMRGVRTGPQLQCPAERRYLATSSRSAGFRSVLYVWLRCAILLQHLVVAVSHSRGCSFCAPRVAGGVQV